MPRSATSSRSEIDGVELLLAEADERPALLDGLRVEPVDEQEREQVRDGSWPRITSYRPGSRSTGSLAARVATQLPPPPRRRRPVVRTSTAHAVSGGGPRDPVDRRLGRSAARRVAGAARRAASIAAVEQAPAVSRASAASTNARTRLARSSGVAAAVASSQWSTATPLVGVVGPSQPSSRGATRAAAMMSSSRPSVSSSVGPSRLVLAVRPSRAAAGEDMADLVGDVLVDEAGREAVSAVVPNRTVTSASAASLPNDRGRSPRTRSAASRAVPVAAVIPSPRRGSCGSGPAPPDGPCGRSAAAGPCRSSACPRTSTRRARRACPSSPRSAG